MCFLCLADNCLAQSTLTLSNIRKKIVLASKDTLVIDTLSIIPNSFSIKNNTGTSLDSTFYTLLPEKGILIIDRKKLGPNDSLHVEYKVFPYLFSQTLQHKEIKDVPLDAAGRVDPFSYTTTKPAQDPFFSTGLNKNGSISRGISFGNNQDVVVNSNLNLQLAGKLNNNIELLLAATDNNIPIQPEGNTQQLQDFDKVFIQLSDHRSKLIAGDFQLYRPKSYFMNFNKKAQGLHFSTTLDKAYTNEIPDTNNILYTSLSAAVSRGKFARNIIQGVEGNQGPYRLRGAENEPFIIVLSGSEKIFIDGVLLQRGQENDYVIDYNTSEITFTPRQMITKDKRIVAEFQYSDKNYARSLIHVGNEYRKNNLKVNLHVYSEQDSKNQPLQQELSNDQKRTLINIGDTVTKAFFPGIDSITFNGSEVLYEKIDTSIGTLTFGNVYVHSTDPEKAHFRLSFSNVGPGNGNYNQVNTSANGRVFQWVMPDTLTGKATGSFEPVILLVTPKKKQMVTASAEYNMSANTRLFVETALSNNDINTFSSIDSKDDIGYAWKLSLNNSFPLERMGVGLLKKEIWKLYSGLTYEYTQKYFSPIERFRGIEFERDWNFSSISTTADQHITGANISILKNTNQRLGYQINSFLAGDIYTGLKQNMSGAMNVKGFNLLLDGSFLNSKTALNHTDFLRHSATVSQKINWLQIGVRDLQELNRFRESATDSLQNNSYSFFEWEAFVNNSDSTLNKYGLSYKQRTDYATKNNSLKKSTFAESVTLQAGIFQNPNQQFNTSITYRKLKILDSLTTFQKPDESMVGRIEYNGRFAKGVIFTNTFYEVGSGLEVKKEFSFIEVAPGQGSYAWTDYNSNGVKELNEFEIAAYSDQARYIKVFTPTNEYIKTYANQFSQQLNLRPAAIWTTAKGIKKAISLLANQTTYRIDRKITNADPEMVFNPFLQSIADTSLVTLNSSLRSTLFFNQTSSLFGLDLSWQDTRNKSLLVNGLESRTSIFSEAHGRWNITKTWSTSLIYKEGTKSNRSEFFNTRDYQINYYETEPKLSFQPNTSFRTSISFRYSEKNNHIDFGGQKAVIQDYGTEIKYNILTKGSLNAKANYIRIAYNDLTNTAVAYEMLESLKAGENYTWNVSYQRTLSNNMQVSISYDGRKSQGNKAIHTGSAQVRAFF